MWRCLPGSKTSENSLSFDAPFVSLFVTPSRGQAASWCDVQTFDGSLSTRYQRVHGIVHIKEPKTRRMTGHAAQQHVLLECPGTCQLIYNMKASILDHKLDTAIWRLTPAQHFANFQRQLRSLGVLHQHYTLHGLSGGGATDHWLQYRDFTTTTTLRSVDL